MRYILRITLVFVSALAFVTPASAEATILVTQPTDFWFDYSEPTLFVAITYQSDTFPSDPQLWLYTEEGVLLVTNDDFIGLQSRVEIEVPAGRYRLRASTCCYEPDVWRGGGEWNIQYELYYNGLQTDPTTTTEVTTSLPPEVSTTTTLPELPTTTLSPGEPPSTTSSTTSTIPETTTTWEIPTTSTEPTTTTTTTVPPTTVPVTEAPPTVTTTGAPIPTVTTQPSTTTTEPTPSTDVSTTVVPATTTQPQTTPPATAPATTPPTSQPTETTSEPPQTAPDSPETTTTTLPPIVEGEAVEPEIAVAYATDPEVLATVTADEATEIFDAIIVDELTPEEAAEIIAAVQEAPPEVREAFEEEINVFDGTFDTYVPLGSSVSVSTRRTVTAATAAIGATMPVANRKKTK